jgi:3-hydroxyisobutyrate dehydrogenase-like beta-hydroxyacid dehydrogenase
MGEGKAMRVAFIGCGNIGSAMARQLLEPPFELAVYDVNPAALEPFRGKARVAGTLAEAAQGAEVVGICVLNDAQVRDAVAGVLPVLAAGAVILVHSTVMPETVRALAATAEAAGVALLDAAVSGGPHGAEARNLVTMAGGDAAALERARPFLAAFSGNIIHAGAVGTGMVLKACNNLVTYIQLMAGHESFGLARAYGLDPALLRRVMTENGNLTDSMARYQDFRAHGPAQLGADGFAAFLARTRGLAEKDLEVALALAGPVGLALPGSEVARRAAAQVFGKD